MKILLKKSQISSWKHWLPIFERSMTSHKCHLHHLLVQVLNYYVIYREPVQSVCEMSAMVNNCVTDPPRWFCDFFLGVSDYRERNLTSTL